MSQVSSERQKVFSCIVAGVEDIHQQMRVHIPNPTDPNCLVRIAHWSRKNSTGEWKEVSAVEMPLLAFAAMQKWEVNPPSQQPRRDYWSGIHFSPDGHFRT